MSTATMDQEDFTWSNISGSRNRALFRWRPWFQRLSYLPICRQSEEMLSDNPVQSYKRDNKEGPWEAERFSWKTTFPQSMDINVGYCSSRFEGNEKRYILRQSTLGDRQVWTLMQSTIFSVGHNKSSESWTIYSWTIKPVYILAFIWTSPSCTPSSSPGVAYTQFSNLLNTY